MIGLINFYKKEERIEKLKNFIQEESDVVIMDFDSRGQEVDAIFLSGSERLITQGDYEEEWFSFIRNSKIPLIGICFGFQLICRVFGAVIMQGKEIKDLLEVNKLRDHFLFSGIPNRAKFPESHQEYVTAVSTPLIPLMASDFCIEAIAHSSLPIFGTQFHFERSEKYGKKILKNFLGFTTDLHFLK
ncbi:MAG: hypothetical protein U9N06_03020 [candidate division WOR-3 bacterium]|nr:hypothetical protein [candidate division WOR-3 bacterium]